MDCKLCTVDLRNYIMRVDLRDLRLFFFFFFFFFFYSKPRPFRRSSTIEQQCEQWAARILKAALGNVAAGSIQLRRPEVSASTQERRAMYGGGGQSEIVGLEFQGVAFFTLEI